MKRTVSTVFFKKYSGISIDENPPSGSRVVPYGLADGQIETRTYGDLKVIVHFRNFANAPRNKIIRPVCCFVLIHINTCIASSRCVFAVGYELNL